MIIFLDESGDLGFDFAKSKTSRFFVITLLVCDDKAVQTGFKRAVERTLKNKLNHKANKRRWINELKGTETTTAIKSYFYRQLPPSGWRIYTVALNKRRVAAHLQTNPGKKKLYNFLARFLLEKVPFAEETTRVSLVVDRCKNNEEIKDFNQYVIDQLQGLLPLNTRLDIDHHASHENAGLQAADLFCWGIWRKYSNLDLAWYRIFGSQISFETLYLQDKLQT